MDTESTEFETRLARRCSGWTDGLPSLAYLGSFALILVIAFTGVGYLLTKLSDGDPVGRFDSSLAHWFARHRTPGLNDLTAVLTYLSETITVIVVALIVVVAVRLTRHRWRDALLVITATAGETTVFVCVAALVSRGRPNVSHLDVAPPTSSFPSGHTAAAICLYGAIAIIASEQLRRGVLRVFVLSLPFLVPVAVGTARMYRGMHFLSDVVAGAVLGALWLAISVRAVRIGVAHHELRSRVDPPNGTGAPP